MASCDISPVIIDLLLTPYHQRSHIKLRGVYDLAHENLIMWFHLPFVFYVLLIGRLRAYSHCDETTLSSDLPDFDDCVQLVEDLHAFPDTEPFYWSRHPRRTARSRQLPSVFKDPSPSNDCEFVVDAMPLSPSRIGGDTFPVRVIAAAANILVWECLYGQHSLGAGVIGPRSVTFLRLRRKTSTSRGGRVSLNGTGMSHEATVA